MIYKWYGLYTYDLHIEINNAITYVVLILTKQVIDTSL